MYAIQTMTLDGWRTLGHVATAEEARVVTRALLGRYRRESVRYIVEDRLYVASDGSLWHIMYDKPPVPTRNWDWAWTAYDYNGPDDDRHGDAASPEACVAAIEEYVTE